MGSEHFCRKPPYPIDSAVAMINLDTVGRLEADRLIVFGARSATEFDSILKHTNRGHALDLVEKEEIYGFSDQNPFYARGVPSLHLFTGAHDDYHSPDDDWQKINYQGLAAVTFYVSDLVSALAVSSESLTPVVALEEPRPKVSRGRGAFFGIVPDFTYSGSGVGIKGTLPKSPAETSGLEGGDVILRIDGQLIADLQGLMEFLVAGAPGDTITIECMRGSSVVTKTAVLSVRTSRQ